MIAGFATIAPEVIGNDYLVLGTVAKKCWQKGIADSITFGESMAHTAQFKSYFTIESEWR